MTSSIAARSRISSSVRASIATSSAEAGFDSPEAVGGLERIASLPMTEKDEIRQTRSDDEPVGTHLCVPLRDTVRIFSTSGTTGTPSYIPLTAERHGQLDPHFGAHLRRRRHPARRRPDLDLWRRPFVAGITFDAFNLLGVSHIPIGGGNTERLMTTVRLLKPDAIALTPSYALHLAEWAHDRGIDTRASSVTKLLVGGEPGGGEPAMRKQLEEAWGATVTEAMGIGDIAASLWGECPEKGGMHFSGRGFVHFELIDPDTGASVPLADGAEGELVYTHLAQEAVPLLRFRSRDHVRLWTGRCACGRTAPRVRCIGRTDDMLIVRGVNVFPSALREIVGAFAPEVSGVISVRPRQRGFRQDPPLKVLVEAARRRGARRPRRAHPASHPRDAAGDDRGCARPLRVAAAQRLQVEAGRLVGGRRRASRASLRSGGIPRMRLRPP